MRAPPHNSVTVEVDAAQINPNEVRRDGVGGPLLTPKPSPRCRVAARSDAPEMRDGLKALLFSDPKINRRSGRDRRATPRYKTEVVCEEKLPGTRHFRLTWDLSTFGLSTHYGPQYARGTRLELVLHLPDDITGPISVMAEVVGVNEESGGLRLAFRNPPGMAVRRIHRYLAGRDPNGLEPAA